MSMTVRLYRRSGGWVRAFATIGLTFALTAALIGLSGKSPITAYEALFRGAFGSFDRAAFALNKATPYIISGIGIALCFRAGIINIGAEGQIALGGLVATWVALTWPQANALVGIPLAFLAGAAAGALWSGVAAAIHVGRGVNEVLTTLLLNFVALLLVGEALHGRLGEPGAGFPQSPLFEPNYWLSPVMSGSQLHVGVAIVPLAAIGGYVLLRHTTLGFAVRVMGASRSAATYAGFSVPWLTIRLMLVAGALAGLAGAAEVLGIHYRLIEGFSNGFGFNAVVVALLGALHPLAIVPAGLFFGFLEAGALSMQREVGVPSSLVSVIQGLTMLFVLAALASTSRRTA
jgi:general nucleoside transport system permease protein